MTYPYCEHGNPHDWCAKCGPLLNRARAAGYNRAIVDLLKGTEVKRAARELNPYIRADCSCDFWECDHQNEHRRSFAATNAAICIECPTPIKAGDSVFMNKYGVPQHHKCPCPCPRHFLEDPLLATCRCDCDHDLEDGVA